MPGLLNPYTALKDEQNRQELYGLMGDVGKGAITGPFTGAPDLLGLAQRMLEPSYARGYYDANPDKVISGDPIRGLVGLDPESKAGMVGEVIDPTGAAAKGIKIGTGLLSVLAIPRVRQAINNMVEPLVKWKPGGGVHLASPAYHGSPHRFDVPSNEYMGTGEGAQAYGWGHYVAESEGTGKWYQESLVGDVPRRTFKGEELTPGTPKYHAGALLERDDVSLDDARREVAGWIKEAESWPAARKAEAGEQRMLEGWQETLDTLNRADSKADFDFIDKGHLYEYDIPDETIDKMLDWDKPLSEQPHLKDFLDENLADVDTRNWTGSDLHNHIVGELMDDADIAMDITEKELSRLLQKYDIPGDISPTETVYQFMRRLSGEGATAQMSAKDRQAFANLLVDDPHRDASLFLRNEYGIPGIRYLDGTSRSAGEGTRNMVLFDPENTVRSVKRDGDEVFRKK